MLRSSTSLPPNATAIAAMAAPALIELVGKLDHEIVHLRRQVAWFQRQIFGQKSERRLPLPDPEQGVLGEDFVGAPDVMQASKTRVVGADKFLTHPTGFH